MVLLRASGQKWILIDCCLRGSRAREAFFSMVETQGIKRLDAVVLTHPHFDHYVGLSEVLEFFSVGDRSVGVFCDSGISGHHVVKIQSQAGRPEREISEYAKLAKTVHRLVAKGQIGYKGLGRSSRPIRIVLPVGEANLVPIAPTEEALLISANDAITSGRVPGSINDLAVVLILTIEHLQAKATSLFASDAESDRLQGAIELWRRHEDNTDGTAVFSVIKVPHHGSKNGHWPELCKMRGGEPSVAAISVGNQYSLPSKEVVREYANAGWHVLSTTTKDSRRRCNRVVQLFGRTTPGSLDEPSTSHNILISVAPGRALTWTPADSELMVDALPATS